MKNVETKMTVEQAKAEIEFCHSFFDSVTPDTSDELIDKYVARCKAARAIIAADETKAEEEPEMTTTTKENATKKLYKVWTYNPDDEVIQESAAKLDIINGCGYYGNRVNVSMKVNRKTLKGAYGYFQKAIAQAVEDGVLDAKVAEFSTYADDVATIQSMFGDKDYFAEYDNVDNSFAYGIDDNGEGLGYYFWFWVKIDETKEEETKMTNETKIANELPKGEVTADSVKAAELIAAYFPNGLHFCGASKGYNKEDVFPFTDDKEKFYAIMYSTPDNSRIELIEVIKYYESGSKRRPLTVIIDNSKADLQAENLKEINLLPAVEGTVKEVIAAINPESLYKIVYKISDVKHQIDRNGKHLWYSYGGRIKQSLAAQILANEGFRNLDEFFAAEKVASGYKDKVLWPRWLAIEKQSEHLMAKIWTEAKSYDETFTANVMPAEEDDNDDELVDEPNGYLYEINGHSVSNAEYVKFCESIIADLTPKRAYYWQAMQEATNDDDHDAWLHEYCDADETIQECIADIAKITSKEIVDDKSYPDDETPEPAAAEPVDEFTAELERLKAAYDKATRELDKADNELFKAREVAKELERKAIAAEDVRFKAKCAYLNFLSDKAEELTAELITPEIFHSDAMVIIKQSGQELKLSTLFALRISNHGKGWEIAKGMVLFGRYDTPAQVEQVIAMLKAAIERGDTEFTFPTIEQLNTPKIPPVKADIRDSLARAMEIALLKTQDFCREHNLKAAQDELGRYNICSAAMRELRKAVA